MLKKIFFFGFILMSITFASVDAQETGSFDTTIPFAGADRTLSCYAPEDYSSPGLVICLHGSMDNSKNMRNVIIGSLNWELFLPNTVIICPDGAALAQDPNDPARDFYAPEGDEAVIDSVIAWAKSQYNIDDSKVYLHGFSLGGRSALKWGLDNPTKIAGLVLNTPAIQSPMDAQNIDGYSLDFNYVNAKGMRISAIVGQDDIGFINTVSMMADSLVANDAILFYAEVEGMAHEITPSEVTSALFRYAMEGIAKPKPILHKFETELYYTTNNFTPKALVSNMGNEDVTDITIDYTINGDERQKSWTGVLKAGEHIYVELNEEIISAGYVEIEGYISLCNSVDYPHNPVLNQKDASFNVFAPAKAIPFKDDFADLEISANNWALKPSGNYISWAPASYLFGSDVDAMAMLNTQLAYSNFGLIESMYSNVFDYSSSAKPALGFDIAFNYTHYSSKFFPSEPNGLDYTDTLEIYISNDNGQTFSSIFKKWGEELRTFETVFTDFTDINLFIVAPDANEWKNTIIDLKEYKVSDKTQFRFDYISGSGGVVYLKNIHFFDADKVSVADTKIPNFSIYPNPASTYINLPEGLSASAQAVEIFNSLGIKLMNATSKSSLSIDQLPDGIYTVKIGKMYSTFVKYN